MSEFITIQVGQCGNQIGSCFWKYALQEYGFKLQPVTNQRSSIKYPPLSETFSSFFCCPQGIPKKKTLTIEDLQNSEIKARTVCIDMEDSVVARFRRGPLRGIFSETCLLTNYPGSGNNWAEGFFTHGVKYYDEISERIRLTAEKCDSLHGFLLMYSLGGGTGSGLGSRVLSLLEDQYPYIDRLVTCVYPAGSEDVITAPYNVALATHELIKNASCVFPVNNRALSDICSKIKSSDPRDKSSRHFRDLNNIIVSMLLHLTSGARFHGSLNVDLNEIATNMVPYPGMHFISSSLSPLSCSLMKAPPGNNVQIDKILSGTWSKSNQLLQVDPLQGIILAGALTVRGNISLYDLRCNINKLEKKGKFMAWSEDSLKMGICSVPPPGHELSALGLFNSSSLSNIFQEVSVQFSKLFRRYAHTHHYTKVEGFEMENFVESLESLQTIAAAYKGLENDEPYILPRLRVV